MTVDLRLGNVLDVLKTMPDGSVHMVCTSPPYWGLRAYGTDPQVWQNGHEPCQEHQWDEAQQITVGRRDADMSHYGEPRGTYEYTHLGGPKVASNGNTCLACGAWRGELGLEPTPELYVEHLVAIFREVRRVMRDDGTLWLNLGDSFAAGKAGRADTEARGNIPELRPNRTDGYKRESVGTVIQRSAPPGLKPKDLVGIPWMVAFALRADGWYLRSDIIWAKPNPMPESVRDRPTKAHEYVFLMSKSPKYYYDAEAIKEEAVADKWRGYNRKNKEAEGQILGRETDPHCGFREWRPDGGRNRRSVWTVSTKPYSGAHFATFPPDLIEPMILAGTSERGVCPQCGAPWERVTERTGVSNKDNEVIAGYEVPGLAKGSSHDRVRRLSGSTYQNVIRPTNSWRPTCVCDAGAPVPATVLDPFSGAGTTGVVAVKHGRNYIGIDLKAEYIEMARERIGKVQIELQGAHGTLNGRYRNS